MITKDKVIETFCVVDEFDKNLNEELAQVLCQFCLVIILLLKCSIW